ncbi:flavodoxin family protein [uncultured Bacteroides sp.]|uniref:flavodoxin family protein n=1 Tax=uncultured Bacteroides sp. TaxID=162156 RepID=UPI002AA7A717|nr:flavodoxin family protein [uncultured Bacteroides sp.]
MSKNILVLTGSPRKGGNSDQLADAFISGAQKAGHTAVKFATANKNIKGCVDCMSCYSKGVACSFNDDFNELAPMVEEADMIVFATPLYWFTFPMQLKAAIDKFFAFLIGKRKLKIQSSALLVCSGAPNEDGFDAIKATYKQIANHMNWSDSGIITVPGINAKSDIQNTDALKRAEELGLSIQ